MWKLAQYLQQQKLEQQIWIRFFVVVACNKKNFEFEEIKYPATDQIFRMETLLHLKKELCRKFLHPLFCETMHKSNFMLKVYIFLQSKSSSNCIYRSLKSWISYFTSYFSNFSIFFLAFLFIFDLNMHAWIILLINPNSSES